MAEISANVTDFLNKFPIGLARPNRYMVEMSLPRGIMLNNSSIVATALSSNGKEISKETWYNEESLSKNIRTHNLNMNRTRAGSNCMSYLYDAG